MDNTQITSQFLVTIVLGTTKKKNPHDHRRVSKGACLETRLNVRRFKDGRKLWKSKELKESQNTEGMTMNWVVQDLLD